MKKNLTMLAVLLMSSSMIAACNQPTEEPSLPTDTVENSSTPEVTDTQTATPTPQVTIDFDFTKEVEIEIYTTLSSSAGYGLFFDEALKMFEQHVLCYIKLHGQDNSKLSLVLDLHLILFLIGHEHHRIHQLLYE